MRARTAGDYDARSRLAPFWPGCSNQPCQPRRTSRQQVAGSFAEPAWPAAVRGRLDRILTQIFGVGVVHADPHPGHVHVTTDGDVCPASVRQDGTSMRGS